MQPCCNCCKQPAQWHYADRGRAGVSPEQVVNDHEKLHELVESRGYKQPAQVFRVPTVWPHVLT